jgi:hypothetical protein
MSTCVPTLDLRNRRRQALHSRSGVGVPMLCDSQPIGVIRIGRYEVRAFSD